MIADMLSSKKLNKIVTVLFIRGKKLNISLVFFDTNVFCYTKKLKRNKQNKASPNRI